MNAQNTVADEPVLKVTPEVEYAETGLTIDGRSHIAKEILPALGNTIILGYKTQAVHWNIVGPAFYGLHKLTEEQYKALNNFVDILGERIRSLGYPAPFSLAALASVATLSDSSSARTTAEMLDELVNDHEKMSLHIRKAITAAESEKDVVSSDILTQQLRFHEDAIWMFKSVLTSSDTA